MSYSLFTKKEQLFELKDHQSKILDKVKKSIVDGHIPSRIGLFLSPGAGKTFLTKHLINEIGYKANNVLIVSPLSAIYDRVWGDLLNVNYDFVTGFFKKPTNFEYSLELFLKEKHIDINNLVLVIDEGHVIKNIDTTARKLCKRIMRVAKTTIILSGTPSGRNDYEFFNLTNLCFSEKDSEYLGASNCGPFYDVTGNFKGIDLLPPTRLREKYDRKSKIKGTDILNIMGNNYFIDDMENWVQNLDMNNGYSWLDTYFEHKLNIFTPQPTKEYTFFRDKYKDGILKFITNRMFVFTVGENEVEHDYSKFINKKILVDKFGEPQDIEKNSKAMLLQEGISLLNYQYAHCKVDEVISILNEYKDDQIIIWSSYIAERDVICSLLEQYNIVIANEDNIKLFKEGKVRGIVASAHADKEAHTWTNCRINIYFNPNDSSTAFSQNRFRTNRIGQKEQVLYFFLYFQEERKKLMNMLSSYNRNKESLELASL